MDYEGELNIYVIGLPKLGLEISEEIYTVEITSEGKKKFEDVFGKQSLCKLKSLLQNIPLINLRPVSRVPDKLIPEEDIENDVYVEKLEDGRIQVGIDGRRHYLRPLNSEERSLLCWGVIDFSSLQEEALKRKAGTEIRARILGQ